MMSSAYNLIQFRNGLCERHPLSKKSFPSWHMGVRQISGNKIDFKTDINPAEKQLFENMLSSQEQDGMKVLELIKKFF